MRALMTLEGIGDRHRSGLQLLRNRQAFREGVYAAARRAKLFRKLIFDKLTGRENGDGRIAWSRVWKLTKMAAQMYLES